MHQHRTLTSRPFRTWMLTIALCLVLAAMLALPAVSSAESCPNAVSRNGPSSQLPDCRAYEMVTPAYKEGFPVLTSLTVASPTISSEGSVPRIEGESIGAFAGAEDSVIVIRGRYLSNGAYYVFTRGGSGWTTTAISLPASQYPEAVSIFSSSDLAESLWLASTPTQVRAAENRDAEATAADFYVRTLNGPVAEVGPVLPPSVSPSEIPLQGGYFAFRGASRDGVADVLYAMTKWHWPGDTTDPGAESLYEYVGTGNSAPLLVGVSGGPGSTSLISKCGTSLGGVAGGEGTAPGVSESGATVIFTPAVCGSFPTVQEIYARIDNGQPDAHTVDISEPSSEDCSACVTVGGVRQAASLDGLSPDGSRVFFLTSQPLLEDAAGENLYEYDFDGEAGRRVVRISAGDSTVPSSTAANVEGAAAASPDGSRVYFFASGVLTKVPNSLGQEAEAGRSNLYLYERNAQYPSGHIVFVLPHADINGGLASSQNGRYLAITSSAELARGEPSNSSDFPQGFEYDAQTGAIVRFSIGQNGYNEDGYTGSPANMLPADDGAVFFETSNPLVPQAVNGKSNVYEYWEGNVSLISDGQDPNGSSLDYISPSGTDVFFQTFDRLVPQDTDSQEDTYDARVDGGFAEPSPQPQCAGDACQGPLSGAPVLLSPGSEFQAGGESITAGEPSKTAAKSKARRVKKKPKRKSSKRKAKRRRGRARKSVASGIGGRP